MSFNALFSEGKFDIQALEKQLSGISFFFVFCKRDVLCKKDGSFLSGEDFLSFLEEINGAPEKNCLVKSAFTEDEYSYAALLLSDAVASVAPGSNSLSSGGSGSAEKNQGGVKLSFSENLTFMPIQSFFSAQSEEVVFVLSRAKSVASWSMEYRFCPSCGKALVFDKSLSCKLCTGCKKQIFPRIEPCVIVLVHKGEKILLARHKGRLTDRFVCISGFIEAGESAEHAVMREVKEETGISVKNICFKGTQGWPFPDQLMLAYEAEWESGEISIQQEELFEAAWFDRTNPPSKLSPGSVAYRLINGLF